MDELRNYKARESAIEEMARNCKNVKMMELIYYQGGGDGIGKSEFYTEIRHKDAVLDLFQAFSQFFLLFCLFFGDGDVF